MPLPTTTEIIDDLAFFDDWEQRYQYIIDLGKSLPPLPVADKKEQYLVKGCQSNVWLVSHKEEGRLRFSVDSDAVIVQGLLVLVLAAFNNKTAQEILAFDINDYFLTLDLERHISPTRGNGLRSIVQKIQQLAQVSQD